MRSFIITTLVVLLAAFASARPGYTAGDVPKRAVRETSIFSELTLRTTSGREVTARNTSPADFANLFKRDDNDTEAECCAICPGDDPDDCYCCGYLHQLNQQRADLFIFFAVLLEIFVDRASSFECLRASS
ncbi:hypothetical protein PLICRDRAFT_601029 [Plicaturopsis crispa FD-325 SS-3]|nr:hypothetical protein PLICRDRAFT_601029 [Plicaturopsis crispa FD-325 SS-3]